MSMNPATLSAVSALVGSGIGALASVTTSWLSHHFQGREQRLKQEAARRERLFGTFVDQASQSYAEGIVHDGLDDPAMLVPLYATINKLRLFARADTVRAAEAVLQVVLETYQQPQPALTPQVTSVEAHDILRIFAESCRSELKGLR